MDHAALIEELPNIERMQTADRIQLARDRRRQQIRANLERERALPHPPSRRPRLRFQPEIELLDAALRGDTDEVERLLKAGANPNSHNEDGLTPLHQCSIDNNEPIVRLLLEHNADVNAKDTELWTPLHAAACCGYTDIVRLLIEYNADLLAVNADGNMPYDICDEDATLDLIESQMANRGITQQYIDEQRGLPEKQMLDDMKRLHTNGQPLNVRMADGSTYLHVAAAHGFYDVAAFLLRCGVEHSLRDNDFWMPVHAAASWNQPDLIELLCEYGADINARTNNGETPLDLTEDEQTRQVIVTVQHNEARKKRLAFGVRDSRRQSRKRKKFESPQQLLPNLNDNPFSARGAIRRQSLRDRNGMTLARIEAQKEQSDLMRSWSKEDVSNSKFDDVSPHLFNGPSTSTAQPGMPASSTTKNAARDPSKRGLQARVSGSQAKAKPMSPDEWLRKLEAESRAEDDEDEEGGSGNVDGMLQDGTGNGTPGVAFGRNGSKKREKKKRCGSDDDNGDQRGNGGFVNYNSSNKSATIFRGSPVSVRQKQGCCCLLM